MCRASLAAVVSLLMVVQAARAEDDGEPVVPASWHKKRSSVAPLEWYCPPSQTSPYYAPGTYPPTFPGSPEPTPGGVAPVDPMMPGMMPPAVEALNDAVAGTSGPQVAGGGTAGRMFNESLDGDFGGMFYRQTLVVGTQTIRVRTGTKITRVPIFNRQGQIIGFNTIRTPVFGNVAVPVTQSFLLPAAGKYAGIRIADNDSPRPTDRLYVGYNYYDGFGEGLNPGFGNVQQNRETIGFEKTFLGGDASFGMRLPFVQLAGPPGVPTETVGDLTISFKYALFNDVRTGNLISTGLMITAPTSKQGGQLSDGSSIPNSVIFQPWVGFVRSFDRAYLQGVSNMFVPSDGRDTIVISNTLAAGYWLYRGPADALLSGISPTFEVHVHTPLNNRDPNGQVFLPDQVNLTGGVHMRFSKATLATAVTVPVCGPRVWNIEALANLTFRF